MPISKFVQSCRMYFVTSVIMLKILSIENFGKMLFFLEGVLSDDVEKVAPVREKAQVRQTELEKLL